MNGALNVSTRIPQQPRSLVWYLEPVDYTHDDITWLGCNTYFEEYVNKFSKKATVKFFVFTEPGKKGEI